MISTRLRRSQGLRILMAAAWLPYLVLCCCPSSVSAFLRCDSSLMAHRAPAHDAGSEGSHHEGHCARAAAAGDSDAETPVEDCCSYRDDGDSTPVSGFVLPPPALTVLSLPLASPQWSAQHRTTPEPVEHHEHSPPVYLSILTLLL